MRLSLAVLAWILAYVQDISAKGQRAAKVLDEMQVEKHWIAGEKIDWKTGDLDPGEKQHATHCSAFAAAACERFGVYLLRPPEHSQVLLANAQYDWLLREGKEQGWTQVKGWAEVQKRANEGELIVAIYKNGDRKKPGHAAIVRPSAKSADLVAKEGPDVIYAGRENHSCASLIEGFKNHPKDEILFFSHAIKDP
jgi:hypothetical protein